MTARGVAGRGGRNRRRGTRSPTPPADTPSVRDTHLAWVKTLTTAELTATEDEIIIHVWPKPRGPYGIIRTIPG